MKAKELIKILEQHPEAVIGVWVYTGCIEELYEPSEDAVKYITPSDRTSEHIDMGGVSDGVFEIGYS